MHASASITRFVEPATLARLSRLELLARTVVEGFVSGLHKSPFHGFSVEFAEHRPYVPGDDLRRLDWRVLGRADKPYIKLYQEETNLRAHLLVDASGSMDYGSGALTKFEYAVRLAACLAYLLVRQQDSVGLAVFGERPTERVSARGTPRHLRELLARLERTRPGGPSGAARSFHDLAATLGRRSLVIVLSDLMEDEEAVIRGLAHFRHERHEVILFHVLDPAELELDFEGLTTFRDLESGERLVVHPQLYRQEYRERLERYLRRIRQAASEGGFDYQLADTSRPLDALLVAYLARRARMF